MDRTSGAIFSVQRGWAEVALVDRPIQLVNRKRIIRAKIVVRFIKA